MPDPFLLAHRIDDFFFDIGGRISPISIRDQMIRGRLIVDRAYEAGVIDSDYPLLVIGAGAGGITAAITAINYGVETTVVEKAHAPFLRQGGCQTRWVDPTQYDWPVSHWRESVYHWMPPKMPLCWRKDFSNVIAASWTKQFRKYSKSRFLKEWYNLGYDSHSTSANGRSVDVRFDDGSTHTFGMALSCVGSGSEKCSKNKYTGLKFWDTDDFEQPNMGLGSKTPRVLISGGGDGALQDFLRIVVRDPSPRGYDKSAKDIYERLKASLGLVRDPNLAGKICGIRLKWAEIENDLYSIEDQAQRAHIWSQNRHDHDNHEKLQVAYKVAIAKLWSLWRMEPKVWAAIRNELKNLLKDPIPDLRLIHPCTHFSHCYGLNRFLVLLFAEFLEQDRNIYTILPNLEVADVTSAHGCANKPRACYGKDHEVYVRPSRCNFKSNGPISKAPGPFNVIILRHGIDPPQGMATITFPRQILPYHVVA